MVWEKVKKSFAYFFNAQGLRYEIRHPKRAISGNLIPLIKHPYLFYRTRNVKGLITFEVGTALYEEVLRSRHKSANIVEVGIYKGMSTIYLAEAAKKVHKRVKTFDWFCGLPDASPVLDPNFKAGNLVSDINEWERNVRKNTSREVVDLTVGDAREIMLPTLKNEGFALAFLDVDLYDVTRDVLFQLGSLASGGEVIIIHDAHSPGIKKAISEFQTLCGHPVKERYFAGNSTVKLTICFS